jgi:hypothetical protein
MVRSGDSYVLPDDQDQMPLTFSLTATEPRA